MHAVEDRDPTEFVRRLLATDPDVTELEVKRANLEDTYLTLVQRVESGQAEEHEKLEALS